MENYIAIGDIHGRYDLLELLLRKVTDFVLHSPLYLPDVKIVFLGDMVDRGPDSFLVVARVKELCEQGRAIAIMGNHEDMMLRYHEKRIFDKNNIWLYNGGHRTVRSYGSETGRYGNAQFFTAFEESGHAAWMKKLPYFHETEKVWFSHAPIPGPEMRKVLPYFSHIRVTEGDFRANKDLLTWTYVNEAEKPEGAWEHDHGKLAVCGHVHQLQKRHTLPRIYPQIIYADTGSGCADFGVLSAIFIENGKFVDYIQAMPSELIRENTVA